MRLHRALPLVSILLAPVVRAQNVAMTPAVSAPAGLANAAVGAARPRAAAPATTAGQATLISLPPALSRVAGEGNRIRPLVTASVKPAATAAARAVDGANMANASRTAQRLAAALSPRAAADEAEKGEIKWIPVLSLRPMQFEVGMREVAEKAAQFRAMTPARQRAYLLKHPIPVIERESGSRHVNKGPMSRKEDRPDDHHHLARAAWEAGIQQIPIKIEKEIDGKKKKKFWRKMAKKNLVYLYDQFGNGPHSPDDLPLDVRGLADDPYRSLAGKVRDLGGYEKTHEPFAEFRWANFLRERVETHPNRDFDQAVKEAMKLARSSKAKRLPGYKGR